VRVGKGWDIAVSLAVMGGCQVSDRLLTTHSVTASIPLVAAVSLLIRGRQGRQSRSDASPGGGDSPRRPGAGGVRQDTAEAVGGRGRETALGGLARGTSVALAVRPDPPALTGPADRFGSA
jgi:hypothetical protein